MLTLFALETVHFQVEYCLFPTYWRHTQPPGFVSPKNVEPMATFWAPGIAVGCFNTKENSIAKIVGGAISYTFDAEGVVQY